MVTDATLLRDAIRPNVYTGITYTARRTQPYTTWYKGEVIAFCSTHEEAERRLRMAKGWL